MEAWIAFAGLLLLMILSAIQRRRTPPVQDVALEEEAFCAHLQAVAAAHRPRGRARPHGARRSAHRLHRALSTLTALQASNADTHPELLPGAQWLADNARTLEDMALSLARDLPDAQPVPLCGRQPRIQLIARELVSHTDAKLHADNIRLAIDAWQAVQVLTLRELWMLPTILRATLMELLSHLATACVAAQRDRAAAETWARTLAHADFASLGVKFARAPRSTTFFEHLLKCLRNQENAAALSWLDRQLDALDLRAERVVEREHARQTLERQWIGNAITTLKTLGQVRWTEALEQLSAVEQWLRDDPTGVYPRMSEGSRAVYRGRVEYIARTAGFSEIMVARNASELAAEAAQQPGNTAELQAHVGYYLIDNGQDALWQRIGGQPMAAKARGFLRRHAKGLYVALRITGTLCAASLLLSLGLSPALILPAALVASEAWATLLHALLRRLRPPRILPRIAYDALPDALRTLVVVPTLLSRPQQGADMMRHLAVLQRANPDPNLQFLLLADFPDAPAAELPDDALITRAALSAAQSLNEPFPNTFLYLHRARVWCDAQKKYMGVERKRGALSLLNRLIIEGATDQPFAAASFEPTTLRGRYTQVITLDSDTLLPPGSALELIGMLTHPLNRPMTLGGQTRRGRAVIQPRMENTTHSVRTRVARILGGDGGVDPYLTATSDIYQDLCGRGSFAGKGIYHVASFHEHAEPMIRPNTVLSHDLIEGELCGAALASDVALYDSQPASLRGWMMRLHRWTRGDWQLLPWLMPWVRVVEGRMHNPLDILSRYKIWDNLRRSLQTIMQLLLLALGIALRDPVALLSAMLLPAIGVLLSPSWRALEGAGWALLLAPYRAYTEADAIVRTLWRVLFSRKHLLEWVTASDAERTRGRPYRVLLWPVYALVAILLLLSMGATWALPLTVLLGAVWLFLPRTAEWLDAPLHAEKPLAEVKRQALLGIARDTWRFFEQVVTRADHFLPPDNLQLAPDRGLAHRTSPTNIGLYLLSCVAAHQLGLIEADEAARRIADTVRTLNTLPKWRGHLYNWYDTRTLAPLNPHYVSTVDSGNLAGCLLACAQALRDWADELDPTHRALPDALESLWHDMDFAAAYDTTADLFYIGIHPQTGRTGDAHYDLLASESRLLSFLAIMRGAVPMRHWQRLGRPLLRTQKGAALASWSGTMFEYLMPALLMRLTPDTLLSATCLEAAREQKRGVHKAPWGISESGYYAFDPQLNYQYRAFGLPHLALRTETLAQVIAPYASALALAVLPEEATDNLLTMQRLGWSSQLGFYEAADYTASQPGVAYQLVKSHMAHHQGMLLCALCNALTDQALTRAFHLRADVEAFELLLEERPIKSPMLRWRTQQKRKADTAAPRQVRAIRQVQPDALPLETQLLYGDGTTLLCDARGGGYIAHNGLMLTRWRPNPLTQGYGLQCYLRDADDGDVWRAAQPDLPGDTRFETGQAVFHRQHGGIESSLSCYVCPLDGAAMASLSLTNTGDAPKRVMVSSFFEVALSSQTADAAHPAFRNLFIETARLGASAAQARRRPRAAGEHFPMLVHVAASDAHDLCWRVCTDRGAFLGREHGRFTPQALLSPPDEDRVGAVVDPCMALLTEATIAPGDTMRIAFATLTADTPEEAAQMASRYADIGAATRALELAQTQAHVTADYLSLDPAAQHQAQRLASLMLYHGQNTQRAQYLTAIQLPREEIWACGLSGDLPILTLRIGEPSHLPLARAILKIHEAWRQWGLWVDLVLLDDHGGDYFPPTKNALQEMVSFGHARDLIGKPGGVHFLDAQVLGAPRTALLLATSALVLSGEDGPLAVQMKALRGNIPTPTTAWPELPRAYDTPELPPVQRDAYNGWGGFTAEGDYCIDLVAGHATPAPWCNILANPRFGTLVTERGAGFTYAGNSHSGRLTPWMNDPVCPRNGEALYLRDERTGQFADLFGQARRVTHSPGFSLYEGWALGIGYALTVFVDAEDAIKHTLVSLKNAEDAPRELSVTAYAAWCMGDQESDRRHARAQATSGMCVAYSPSMRGVAYLAMPDTPKKQHTCDRTAFLGLGGKRGPRGIRLPQLDTLGSDDPCAVLRGMISLAPRTQQDMHIALGFAASLTEAQRTAKALGGCARARFDAMRLHWSERLGMLTVRTPDRVMNHLLNRWLPYQLTVSRLWARAGFYQAGGAYGFRDQLQDTLALIHTDPASVRAHLLLAAAHQFEAGDVQHWWHPLARGVRTRISDDLLFLPFVAAAYVHATGDKGVLRESVPYLTGAEIPAGQEDLYTAAEPSALSETLLQHCLRAIRHVALGAHGLPLMGGGDWNDAMNRVGIEGQGESVWLGWFFAATLREFAPLCTAAVRDELLALETQVLASAQQHAWDGAWYRRAWFDDGHPLGVAGDSACELDCVAQSWAVLAGSPRERGEQAMQSLWDRLIDHEHGIARLLTPPFDGYSHDPGYIQGYLPGVRENGGQYTHAAAWAVQGFAGLGQNARAWALYRMLMPYHHSDSVDAALRYRVEPYVCAADVYTNPQQVGRGGWTWYTGSASWLWIAGVQTLLGFEKVGNRLRFAPRLPDDWSEVSCNYRYGDAIYALTARRDAPHVLLDGERQSDGWIELKADSEAHEAVFPAR